MGEKKRAAWVETMTTEIYSDLASIDYKLEKMLPKSVLESVNISAKSVNTDPLYISSSLVSVFSSVISNSCVKATPTHKEPLILFTAILGPKGTGKVRSLYCICLWKFYIETS